MIRKTFKKRSVPCLSFPARLREIVNRASEGFGTRNYREAVAMLGQCSQTIK
jgi:hypothetical protein